MNSPTLPPQRRLRPAHSLVSAAGMAFILLFATTAGAAPDDTADPTAILRNEHGVIGKLSAEAADTAADIRSSGTVETDRIAKLHDFFVNFADRCHHAKEERELFPALRELNVDPVILDLLIKQHEEGRILLDGVEQKTAELRETDSARNREALARYLEEYAKLMERHIDTENAYLWERAADRLSVAEKQRLVEAFRRIEHVELGEGFHEKYHAMALELLDKNAD